MSSDLPPTDPAERFRHVVRLIWSRFLTGVMIMVPLIVTLWVLSIAYSFIGKISAPIWDMLPIAHHAQVAPLSVPDAPPGTVMYVQEGDTNHSPPLLNFITTLLMLIGVGFLATHVLGRQLIDRVEAVLMRVPLVAPLYGAIKQMLDSFRSMKSGEAKRVVYIEYPSEGSLLIGFVTGHYFEPKLQRNYTLVFLPMAPNPLAGFVVAVPDERIIECSLTFEEASKLIVSGGLVVPPSPPSAEPPTLS